MTRGKKPKYKITLLEAQRRRLEALERWFEFVKGKRPITAENFNDELLFPTYHALGGVSSYSSHGNPSEEEVDEVKRLVVDGFKQLAEGGTWFIPLQNLEISISPHGTGYEGRSLVLGQLGIAQLLRNEEWRTGCCSWCGDSFLKKKRGTYCSLRCSQHMRTFKTRNPRGATLLKAAAKAKKPIAAYLLTQRAKPERYLTTCPVCSHEFEVKEIPASVLCPSGSHDGYIVAGSFNSKPIASEGRNG